MVYLCRFAVYFLYIQILIQMGCSYYTKAGTSTKEGYVCDNNDRLWGIVTILYRGITYAFPYPVFAFLINDCLPLIDILLPEDIFYVDC